jgi:hypothetical protein
MLKLRLTIQDITMVNVETQQKNTQKESINTTGCVIDGGAGFWM